MLSIFHIYKFCILGKEGEFQNLWCFDNGAIGHIGAIKLQVLITKKAIFNQKIAQYAPDFSLLEHWPQWELKCKCLV